MGCNPNGGWIAFFSESRNVCSAVAAMSCQHRHFRWRASAVCQEKKEEEKKDTAYDVPDGAEIMLKKEDPPME